MKKNPLIPCPFSHFVVFVSLQLLLKFLFLFCPREKGVDDNSGMDSEENVKMTGHVAMFQVAARIHPCCAAA